MAAIVMLCLPGGVLADWDAGDPFSMHFPQLPDLTLDGLGVTAGPGGGGPIGGGDVL